MSWRELFNGRDLGGWAATGDAAGWDVDGGCIRCRAERGGYLYTLDRFEDFELSLEYRTEPRCNSGVFFRWSDLQDPVNTGLEIQILDTWGRTVCARGTSTSTTTAPPGDAPTARRTSTATPGGRCPASATSACRTTAASAGSGTCG